MKRMLTMICAASILLNLLIAPMGFAQEEPPITVFVNGEQLEFDVDPMTENDRTLVPMRFIFEALGAAVDWDDNANTATAVKDDVTIQITIDDTTMLKNGEAVVLDVPARLVSDRTLVPVRAISEGLGAKVDWVEETKQVLITMEEDNPAPTEEPTPTPTPTPAATPTAKPTEKPEGEYDYSFDELSQEDMETLKQNYETIRYGFEQLGLPSAVLQNNDALIQEIRKKSSDGKEFVENVWTQIVFDCIITVQSESESTYILNINEQVNEEELLNGYLSLMKEAGLEPENYFDCSYETLEDGSVMLLLTFDETDTILACQYIGIVVQPDDTVRYFTAETDTRYPDNLFFCEITLEGRTVWGITGFAENEFIEAAELVLSLESE